MIALVGHKIRPVKKVRGFTTALRISEQLFEVAGRSPVHFKTSVSESEDSKEVAWPHWYQPERNVSFAWSPEIHRNVNLLA
jgi:hypothetical protein